MIAMTCRTYVAPKEPRTRPDYPSGKGFDFVDRPERPDWCGKPATRYLEWLTAPDPEPMASFTCDDHADAVRRTAAGSEGNMRILRDVSVDDAYAQHQAANWDRLPGP